MKAWLRRTFPTLSRLDGEQWMALPFLVLIPGIFFVVALVGIGDRLGLAYGERLNPPPADPSCGIRPEC